MEENLLLRHHTAEQQQHILNAQLLKQKVHIRARHGNRRRLRRLQGLLITRTDREAHLRSTRRWHLNAAEYVPHQRLQRIIQALDVHRVNRSQAIPERFRVVQSRHQHETLWRIHYAVVRDGGDIRYGCGGGGRNTRQGSREGLSLLLLIDRFVRGDCNGLVEAQTRTVVPVRVNVRQHGDEEFGLIPVRAETPSQRLAKLEIKTNLFIHPAIIRR